MLEYSRDFPSGINLQEGYFVYRYWSKDGECLYVGMVGGFKGSMLLNRLGTHAGRRTPWVIESHYIDWIALESSEQVVNEEATQIRVLQPRYNTTNNGFCRRNLHDLSLPNALKANSSACRQCINARNRQRYRETRDQGRFD